MFTSYSILSDRTFSPNKFADWKNICNFATRKSDVMMNIFYYKVAGHVFSLSTKEDYRNDLQQYEPFLTEATDNTAFSIVIVDQLPTVLFHEELRQEDEGQTIVAGHLSTGEPYFEFWLGARLCATLLSGTDYKTGKIEVKENWLFGVNNAIMVMYAMATSNSRTALFHSSVVSYQGLAYMFLGHSGTGKSTHSSLWLKYINGTELVNDDNPVVRILDNNEVRVYGSPWSGKTPCYRNVSYPVGAIVKLSQAPYNRIERLKGVKAYAAVMPSISGKRWDKKQAEGLHETENLLAQFAAIWHLDCLPDEAAALLCCKNCTHEH